MMRATVFIIEACFVMLGMIAVGAHVLACIDAAPGFLQFSTAIDLFAGGSAVLVLACVFAVCLAASHAARSRRAASAYIVLTTLLIVFLPQVQAGAFLPSVTLIERNPVSGVLVEAASNGGSFVLVIVPIAAAVVWTRTLFSLP